MLQTFAEVLMRAPRLTRIAVPIGELPRQRWSLQQISRHLRRRFPDQPVMWLCHESIYRDIHQPGSVFLRPSNGAGQGLSSRCSRSTSSGTFGPRWLIP